MGERVDELAGERFPVLPRSSRGCQSAAPLWSGEYQALRHLRGAVVGAARDALIVAEPAVRPNLLLIGPDAVVGECLDRLIASVASPVLFCDGAKPTFTNGPIRSLVVRDVDRLTRTGQERLLDWLNRQDVGARVIATSARPVFPHVERGAFSEALYYRINTVTLVLSERPDVRWVDHALQSTGSCYGAPPAI
jgi:hypothetical protein